MQAQKYEIVDRNGNVVPGTIVPDGGKIRVSMTLMDSAAPRPTVTRISDVATHRPGSQSITDADRAKRTAMYAAADKKLETRWKDAPPVLEVVQVRTAAPPASAPTDRAAAYARRDLALSQRWKSGGVA